MDEFKNREKYIDAVLKWKEDLTFIQNYNINAQRHVMGSIVSPKA